MVLELNKEETNNDKFSINRFESVMLATGTTWADINNELGYNVEPMFKNRNKPPMLNVVCKACNIMGLPNSDYVTMKSDTYKLCNNNKKVINENKRRKYSDNEIQKALELLKDHTYKEVSEMTGINKYYLSKLNKKADCAVQKRKRYSDKEISDALSLLKEYTYKEVSEMSGINEGSLRKFANKAGIKMSPNGHRYLQNDVNEVDKSSKNYTIKKEEGNSMDTANKIAEVVEQKEINKEKETNTSVTNNSNKEADMITNSGTAISTSIPKNMSYSIEDIFNYIDKMSNSDLNKIASYVNGTISARQQFKDRIKNLKTNLLK